jgi:hypothetical protein
MTSVTRRLVTQWGLAASILLLGSGGVAGFAHADDTATTQTTTSTQSLKPVNEAEQANDARQVVTRGTVLAQRISQLLEEARREADIIRVTCLNDKLTQVNANLRTAQTRLEAFEGAATPEQRQHEATVLNVLGQKFQLLDAEANRCVGQDLYLTGETKVITEIDTALQPFENNAATPPPPPSTVVSTSPPPVVSGTK